MKKVEVSPSILSANFLNLEKDILDVYRGGAKYLHFDVMDGHFVPNISFGSVILKQISKEHLLINDVHLMITDPNKYLLDFINSGADIITFHYEALNSDEEIFALINRIKSYKVKAGISIKPNTNVDAIVKFLPFVDLVLVMSVEPGFGGQKFMFNSVEKIKNLVKIREESNRNFLIEVDGGINNETSKLCIEAGVDILVAGSYIYNKEDKKAAIESLIG